MAAQTSERNEALAPQIGEWRMTRVMPDEAELPDVGARVTFEWMGVNAFALERWTGPTSGPSTKTASGRWSGRRPTSRSSRSRSDFKPGAIADARRADRRNLRARPRPRDVVEALRRRLTPSLHAAFSRHGRPCPSTIAASSRSRGTERSRSSSVGSSAGSVAVQSARPARKPEAPPRQDASTARREVVRRDALREHDPRAGEHASISRACRVISAGSPAPRAAPGTCRATAAPRRARARPRRSRHSRSSGPRTTGSSTESRPRRRRELRRSGATARRATRAARRRARSRAASGRRPRGPSSPTSRRAPCPRRSRPAPARARRRRGSAPWRHVRRDHARAVVAVDQEARRVRAELARDGELEARQRASATSWPMLGEHRPQRLALVHRDHREGARSGGRSRRVVITRRLPQRDLLRLERVRARDLRVVAAAVLDRPLLRLVVDVDEPEALRVAERPLEVVQERPVAVADDGHALLDRVVQRLEVVVDESTRRSSCSGSAKTAPFSVIRIGTSP